LELSIRQSEIENQKSKMAGAFGNRFRDRGNWGCGAGAATEESTEGETFVANLGDTTLDLSFALLFIVILQTP